MIAPLTDALAERGYDTLTAVQEAVTKPELQDADLLVSAQTGSGKTVGFGLAIGPTLLQGEARMAPAAEPMALVIAPTRELALQVMRELTWLYAKAGARVTSCVGGMDMRDERRALDRGAHIVVGTPGRLRDHIQRGSLDMSGLRAIILDEADEMLDLGFREDLEFMLGEAPSDRRTLMFSATVPTMIERLAKTYQRDAVRVTTLTGGRQHSDISYHALRVAQPDAENAIINVLRYHDAPNAIVFANTRAAVNRLTSRLANRGFSVVCLSGELSQSERTNALQAMRDGRARVCVATDVAARGIDLPNLELVIHADLPSNSEALLHRSGRTGRAGRKGISALIVPPKVVKKAERLLKFGKITAEWLIAPNADEILKRDEERLIADPVWTEDATEKQTEFAAKLLELYAPEKVAAAYLKLYLDRQSAPEELRAPDERPTREERAPFGPSAWFSLSVGRDDRAEPRWILPLICRVGDVNKSAIGAIRVQDSETFVELQQAAVDGFMSKLSNGNELEDGIKVRKLDNPPKMSGGGGAGGAGGGKPRGKPREFNKGPQRSFSKPGASDDTKRDFKPRRPGPAHREDADPQDTRPAPVKPYKPKSAKPDYKAGGKPSFDRKPGGKPKAAAGAGKPSEGGGKPKPHKAGASDPSKSFKRPGGKPTAGGKPGKGKPRAGGTEPPRRKS